MKTSKILLLTVTASLLAVTVLFGGYYGGGSLVPHGHTGLNDGGSTLQPRSLTVSTATVTQSFTAPTTTRISGYLSTLQTGTTTFGKINFNRENFDTLNEYSTSSSSITVTTGGDYKIELLTSMNNNCSTSFYYNVIQKNGTTVSVSGSTMDGDMTNDASPMNSLLIRLVAGDVIAFYYQNSGSGGTCNSFRLEASAEQTHFSMEKMTNQLVSASTSPSGGMTIGSEIVDVTTGSILFSDLDGNLDSDPLLTFSTGTKKLTIGGPTWDAGPTMLTVKNQSAAYGAAFLSHDWVTGVSGQAMYFSPVAGSVGIGAAHNGGAQISDMNFSATHIFTNANFHVGSSAVPLNKFEVYGAGVIGSDYVGVATAATNGLSVEGNMGIGLPATSTPASQLVLYGSANHLLFDAAAGSDNHYIDFGTAGSVEQTIHYTNSSSISPTGEQSGIDISGSTKFVKASPYRMGVGTLAPASQLTVVGSSQSAGAFQVGSTTGTYALLVSSGDLVGVGTRSPSTKFHVSSGVVTVDGTGAGLSVIGTSSATYFVGNGSLLTNLPSTGYTMYVGTFTVSPGSRTALSVTKTTKTGLNSITTGDICSVAFVSYSNSGPPSPSAGDVSASGSLDIWWTNPSASNLDPGNVVLRYFCVRP